MLQALLSFFAIIDPIGNILIFHIYSQGLSVRDRQTAALIAVAAAFFMLVAFSLGGEQVLDYLGIEPESFQIAAGLLLLPPAYRLVMEGQPGPVDVARPLSPWEFALVPLATPLIAGPGALAATTSLAAQVGTGATIAAFSIVLLITLAALSSAVWLFDFAGEAVLKLLARMVGIVLFAIAVDFVLDGTRAFVETL